jgi:hypothetical protein
VSNCISGLACQLGCGCHSRAPCKNACAFSMPLGV